MADNRYGRWAGSPSGYPEDVARCAAEVPEGGRSPLFHQCSRKRGHGPHGMFCKQHARQLSENRVSMSWLLPGGYRMPEEG